MKNEPVAWMCKDDDVITDKFKKSGKGGDCSDYNIPLYTHPADRIAELEQAEIKRLEEQLSIAYEENDNYWIEKGKEK